jgi:hypothetical protein
MLRQFVFPLVPTVWYTSSRWIPLILLGFLTSLVFKTMLVQWYSRPKHTTDLGNHLKTCECFILWLFNSSPWYRWPMEIYGLPLVYLLNKWWFSMANCECHNQLVDFLLRQRWMRSSYTVPLVGRCLFWVAVFSTKSGDWVSDLPVLDNKTAQPSKNERLEDGCSIGNCNLWSSVGYPTAWRTGNIVLRNPSKVGNSSQIVIKTKEYGLMLSLCITVYHFQHLSTK